MEKEIHYITPFEAGLRDAQAGIYDKWYRWHNKDEEYDKGWQEGKREDLEHIQILEGY